MITILSQLFDMSIQAGFVIAVILIVRALFSLCKVPKRFAYLLWIIPFLRLVCPWTPESSWSILPEQSDWMYRMGLQSEMQMSEKQPSETPSSEKQPSANRSSENLPSEKQPAGFGENSRYIELPEAGIMEGQVPKQDISQSEGSLDADTADRLAANRHPFNKQDVLGIIWLAGVILLLVYSVLSYVRLKNKLVGNVHLKDNIYLADYIDTPFVSGIVRPVIYLPSDIEKRDMEYVIAHEQVHIRRKDYLIKIAAFLVACVHWLNPLAWIAFICMGKDMEMSCDEKVLRDLGEECKGEYATALLELTSGRRRIAGVPLAFGEGDTKGRIKNIMKYKKPAAIIGVPAIAAIAVLSVVLLTSPGQDIDNDSVNTSNERTREVISDVEKVDYDMVGVYEMEASPGMESFYIPKLMIHKDNQFEFRYNPLSSYYASGDYRIEGGILTATTSDGLYRYKFQVNEDGTLTYMDEMSPNQSVLDENARVTIVSGARFVRIVPDAVATELDSQFAHAPDDISEPVDGKVENVVSDEKEEIEIIAPVVSEDTLFGADGPKLDYVGEDMVIFHGYFGLFVYSIKEKKIIRSVDLKSIGCNATRGDYFCEVMVSEDGSKVYLNPLIDGNMYVFYVETNQLYKQKSELNSLAMYSTYENILQYLEGKGMFYAYQSLDEYLDACIAERTMDASVRDFDGWRSTECIPMETDGRKTCAYLELETDKIMDLYYVEDGVRVKVFGE